MSENLKSGESLEWIITQIAEGEGPASFEAAKKLINEAGDRDLRTSLTVQTTKIKTAKDSVEDMNVFEDTVQYVKDQFALIYVQAFRMGQSHQSKVDKEIFNNILTQAQKANEASDQEVTEEGSKEA